MHANTLKLYIHRYYNCRSSRTKAYEGLDLSEFPCLISDTRTCKPTPPKDMVFIIGSGNPEFEEEMKAVKEVLKGFGFQGYFALLSEEEKGLDAFCDKICSKILNSLFCVVMLNAPITLEYIDKVTGDEEIFRAPRANVYYEFGIAIALMKRVIPLMREDLKLPFDIQHLDAIPYENIGNLKEKLTEAVKATLLKPSREKIAKMPRIGLLLVDQEGNVSDTISVQPAITKIRYLEKEKPSTIGAIESAIVSAGRLTEAMQSIYGKTPEKDLVPIGIEIWNDGEMPAENILVFLKFPEDCELIEESDAVGGFVLTRSILNPTQGGLHIDPKDKTTAKAWLNRLGNDRMTRKFDKMYVRFPTEEEKEYKADATVIQDNCPPTYYDFRILVKPKIVEETRYKATE